MLVDARIELDTLAKEVPPGAGHVHLNTDGDVAELVIDNPGARNAITVQMMVELADAVAFLQDWTGACVVLRSADPASFCSGGHLGQVQKALSSPARGRQMAMAMGTVLDALLGLPQISVAAIEGPAIGGGAEIATACDFRVMSDDARIHFIHARLGVAPGWGGTGRLVAHVGRKTALRVLAEAKPLSAGECLSLGLVEATTTRDAVAAARRLLEPLQHVSGAALRAIKRQVVGGTHFRARGLAAEADAFASVWGGPDHQAALARVLGES